MCAKLAPSPLSVIHQECYARVMRGCQTPSDPRIRISLHLDLSGSVMILLTSPDHGMIRG